MQTRGKSRGRVIFGQSGTHECHAVVVFFKAGRVQENVTFWPNELSFLQVIGFQRSTRVICGN
jgi:hypothetical protein